MIVDIIGGRPKSKTRSKLLLNCEVTEMHLL